MSRTIYLAGQSHSLSPKMVIGQGGEAVIYQLKSGEVLKLYLAPSDPLYAGSTDAQAAAKLRLAEQQRKLPNFPRNLPKQVTAPSELAYDRQTGGRIVGYSMPLLKDMEVLLRYSDRSFRQQNNIDANQTIKLFQNLYSLVEKVHQVGVVIGDFNDLNVMVNLAGQAHLVDADSMQFGQFPCRTFTARFVDPLHCAPDQLLLMLPHNTDSDWYAFSTMLFQCLLLIHPYYGGVHRPTQGPALRNDARVLHRLTVFSPEVIYPKVAIPYASLPDELMEYFQKTFEQDQRGTFPTALLNELRWTTCTNCGLWHARATCPSCAAPGVVTQTVVRRGTVTVTRLFHTPGRIVFATQQNGEPKYLYHEADSYKREDRKTVLNGGWDGSLRVRLWSEKTVLGKASDLIVLHPNGTRDHYETETVGRLPIFDANAARLFWLDNGRLVGSSRFAPTAIGDILTNQTLLWVGSRFGFGFYRAASLVRGFVFDVNRTGLNDNVPLPIIRGNLLDASCTFSDHLAWFMLSLEDGGVLRNFCYVINDRAELVAEASAVQGDDSWLGDGIRGRLAIGKSLYAATDTGIVRIGLQGRSISVDREFPDTEPFVNAETKLLAGKGGLLAVSTQDITLLHIQ